MQHIRFLLEPGRVRLWQAEVLRAAAARPGLKIGIGHAPRQPRPAGLDLCYRLEALIYRCPDEGPLADVSADAIAGLQGDDTAADLTIDLAGTGPLDTGLSLDCDGQPLETGAASAVLAGDAPHVTLTAWTGGTPRRVATWTVAVEDREVLRNGVGYVLGRAVQMIGLAVASIATGATTETLTLPGSGATERSIKSVRPLLHFSKVFAERLSRRLTRRVHEAPRWMTAWRMDETGEGRLPVIKGRPFHVLPDDGHRFYADPFPVQHEGRRVLFVEEFPFATGRGVISALDWGKDGPEGVPKPVLELDCHLSFPFLIEEAGELYMIPETSGRGTVELFRCSRFPDRWDHAGTLIDGIDLGDATVLRHNGRFYLFGAVRPRWCSTWDGLEVWSADRLTGPWRRVGNGPVMVDAGEARPAGHVIQVGDKLIRPFQDSGPSYGAGLGFADITRLDPDGFAETVITRLRPAAPFTGLHSYNRGAGIEVIDLFGRGKPVTAVP